MKKTGRLAGLAAGIALASGIASVDAQQVVQKTAYDGSGAWSVGPWNKAKGSTSIVSEAGAKHGRCARIETSFSGKDFEFAAYELSPEMLVPGRIRKVVVRGKLDDPGYGFVLNLKDGWGCGGKPFEKPLKFSTEWQEIEVKIPADWVQPVTIVGVGTHNWGKQSQEKKVTLWIDEIRVETDLADVDLASGALKGWTPDPNPKEPDKSPKECPKTALVAVELSPAAPFGVFTGEEPALALSMRNWLATTLKGTLTWNISDYDGNRLGAPGRKEISADSIASVSIPVPAQKYGIYTVKADLDLSDGKKISKEMKLAKLPPLHNLSREQKIASPYGMNVHSGGRIVIEPFMKAGIVWFREYAFSYDWLLKAKGGDKKYAGWPYFPKIVQAYRDLDVMLLPVMQKSIKPPQAADGKISGPLGPDAAWRKEIADVVQAFPDIQFWELSNEYDLDAAHRRVETLCGWKNYQLYHEAFAQVLKALEVMGGGPYFPIENGRAGIWPELARDCVKSGHFAQIYALNSHHYCGVDAPERNFCNANMDMVRPRYFFDDLREQKRAASADGIKRQSWFTEFGWDILAGRIVNPYQQAAYLPRAWMLQMAAGTDKCFWFYNFDSATPKVFFDGMGLLDARGEPKANLCSLAGITNILPQPEYVGSINAGGDNTHGYVFRNDGKLVASLWTIKGDEGPEISFAAGELKDWFANPLQGRKAKLKMTPIYLVGLSKDDPFYLQTAYEVESPHLMTLSPADKTEVVVRVANNRGTPISGEISAKTPEGWECPAASFEGIAPGQSKDIVMPLKIPNGQKLGQTSMTLHCKEAGKMVKEMPVAALVRPGATIAAPAIVGSPGKTEIKVSIGNQAARALSGKLRLELPSTWKADKTEYDVAEIPAGGSTEVSVPLEWSSGWPADQSAMLRFLGPNELDINAPIIPPQYQMRKAKAGLKMDGDLSDWPADSQMPSWMLGRKMNDTEAKIFLAWAPEGIYGAVEVKNSRIVNQDPKWFWACDALELFLDARGDKTQREYGEGDHQFWFVPLPDQNRVYVGQWKRGKEISANREDIAKIQSGCKRKGDGYVMEFLLPASDLKAYKPAPGSKLGVNLNLTVFGKPIQDEVYWPNTKASGLGFQPQHFGTLDLQP